MTDSPAALTAGGQNLFYQYKAQAKQLSTAVSGKETAKNPPQGGFS